MNIKLLIAKFFFRFERANFYQNLAKSLDNTPGVTIYEMLKKIVDRYPETPTGIIAAEIVGRFPYVAKFSEAIKPFIPDQDYAVISSSEDAGDLNLALFNLGKSIENFGKITSDFFKKISPPLMLVLASHVFFLVLGFEVIPAIKQTMESAGVPLTKLGFAGNYIGFIYDLFQYWVLFYLLIGLLIFGLYFGLTRYTGKLRNWLDLNVLPFILYRSYNGAVLLMNCANLARKSGSRIPNLREVLLKVKENTKNEWILLHLNKILGRYAASPQAGFQIFDTGIIDKKTFYRLIDIQDYAGSEVALEKVESIILDEMPKIVGRQAFYIWAIVFVVCMGGTVFTYLEIVDVIDNFKKFKEVFH